MNAKDLRDLSEKELLEHLAATRKEIFGLRFQHATGQLEDTAALAAAKKDLARGLTVARQRGIDVERELRLQSDS